MRHAFFGRALVGTRIGTRSKVLPAAPAPRCRVPSDMQQDSRTETRLLWCRDAGGMWRGRLTLPDLVSQVMHAIVVHWALPLDSQA